MKPRRPKAMFRDEPTRRKDRKVAVRRPGNIRWRTQHAVDRGIRMIERNGVDAIEKAQVVLIGRVISVPRNNVQRRVIDRGRPELTHKLRGDVKVALTIFVCRYRCFEVARVRQAIGTDWAEFREAKG